jgi:hypothetical protein
MYSYVFRERIYICISFSESPHQGDGILKVDLFLFSVFNSSFLYY